MGYDMEWVNVPAEKTETVERIWQEIRRLGHGHPEVSGLFEKMDEARDYYFRVNIFGMARYRQVMIEAGMLDCEYQHTPFDRDRELSEELILREYDITVGLPPAYKFGSNDGWVVSPKEIEAALAIWDGLEEMKQRELVVLATADLDEEGLFEWVQRWFDYWRAAKDHGGFAVF